MSEANNTYWVLSAGGNPNAMLLNSLPAPGQWVGWIDGEAFAAPPKVPVTVRIKPGYERSDPPVFKEVPQIMTAEFFDALRSAGVDNIDVYDATLESQDGSVRIPGYKAYNIVGVVSATDLGKSEFAPDNPSRQIDASVRGLVVDQMKAKGLLLFRLAESVDTILIHNSVKVALEVRNFTGVRFTPPSEHLS
jgi:hypothetical protein